MGIHWVRIVVAIGGIALVAAGFGPILLHVVGDFADAAMLSAFVGFVLGGVGMLILMPWWAAE